MRNMKISVIIPAFNESNRVSRVIAPCEKCNVVDEILVVDDCSTDDLSSSVAGFAQVTLIRNRKNLGKSPSMVKGARQAKNELLVFLDADLRHLKAKHIASLAAPIARGNADMTIGYREGSNFWQKHVLGVEPFLAGERGISRNQFLEATKDYAISGFQMEVFLNKYFLDKCSRIEVVNLNGVVQTTKSEKIGQWKGRLEDVRVANDYVKHFGVRELIRQRFQISMKYHIKKKLS